MHPERDQRLQAHRPGIARRFPHGLQDPDPAEPYCGERARRRTGPGRVRPPGGGPFRNRMAYFRSYPVLAQNSFKITCFHF